ncbi:hypothetical protein F5890DRAFT_979462 [Lentinula detonsa]|uniref:Uncharacterized protein n=1 Tax=Lentinula detonsa TaxID=2804962 RepID=A0AA38QB02_9AGAR|nr:hypothetical protein F5890DRAFT_979462 [Lentinula detonsa]
MASPSTPSRSRYSDLPKLDNADGAIDWARKVRALQQQVDADEEAEYKRLQEEIAASRIARKRRSRGGFVSPTSAEFASSRESLSGVSRNSSTSDLKSVAERQQNQAEALQKLAGSSTLPSNTDTTSSIATARAWMTSTASNATASKPSGPMCASPYLSESSTVDHSASSRKNVYRERTISSPSPAFPLIDPKSPVEAGREIPIPSQETASLRRPVSTNFTPPKTSAQTPRYTQIVYRRTNLLTQDYRTSCSLEAWQDTTGDDQDRKRPCSFRARFTPHA